MFLLFLLGCGAEPETAEEWCEVAHAASCECPEAPDVGVSCEPADIPVECATEAGSQVERWGEEAAAEYQRCRTEHPCPSEWDLCGFEGE